MAFFFANNLYGLYFDTFLYQNGLYLDTQYVMYNIYQKKYVMYNTKNIIKKMS